MYLGGAKLPLIIFLLPKDQTFVLLIRISKLPIVRITPQITILIDMQPIHRRHKVGVPLDYYHYVSLFNDNVWHECRTNEWVALLVPPKKPLTEHNTFLPNNKKISYLDNVRIEDGVIWW